MLEPTHLESSTAKPASVKSYVASHKVLATLVVVTLTTSIYPPFMRLLGPQRYEILGISEAQWSIYVASRGLLFILFVLGAGVLGDVAGSRRTLLLLLMVFIFGNIYLVLRSPVTPAYMIVYSLLAILVVMINTLAITLVILSYAGRKQIFAVVVYSVFAGFGFLLSPILTRAFGQRIGINAVFVLPLLLTVLGFWLTLKNVPESLSAKRVRRQDAIALAALTAGICLMIYAGVLSGSLGWTHPIVLWSFALGGIILLAVASLKNLRQLGKWRYRLIYGRELSVAVFAGIVLYLAFYAVVVQMFNYLSKVMQYDLAIASLAMTPVLIGALIQNTKVIRWTSQLGVRQAMAAGLVLVALPTLALSLLQLDVSHWILLPCLLVVGFGFILCNSPRLLLLSSSVPKNLSATAQSIGSATANLGAALAYAFMMTLVAGFGMRAYIQTLESFNLTQAQIISRLLRLAEFGEQISVVFASEEQTDLLREIDFWLLKAYVTGLSRAMLVLGIVCLFSAAIVYIGLSKSEQGEAHIEDQFK
jgi:MFS transporter, DHA2 family, methylenomycin A resistance protein